MAEIITFKVIYHCSLDNYNHVFAALLHAMEINSAASELFEEFQIGQKECKETAWKAKRDKAPGPDNMHTRVLRKVAEQISGM